MATKQERLAIAHAAGQPSTAKALLVDEALYQCHG
eukprot:CAMPEP_0114686252 /NCGR_PEP_ID=MMETSP0191-20121206/61321_1 /TAXON_ID=126664 /ORGANISM="Sorites sp." /LENGTH=34 /DNA_ID= /DNA_START= /DNA_END= /DNA_ORIENTATION=